MEDPRLDNYDRCTCNRCYGKRREAELQSSQSVWGKIVLFHPVSQETEIACILPKDQHKMMREQYHKYANHFPHCVIYFTGISNAEAKQLGLPL